MGLLGREGEGEQKSSQMIFFLSFRRRYVFAKEVSRKVKEEIAPAVRKK